MSWDDLKAPLFTRWKPWWLSRHPMEVGEYSWSYLFERGKQIRPRLFCELLRYLCPEHTPSAELAFMIECVHVASLILDDLPCMDNASERRGMTTLHQKFSIRKALLIVHDVLELAWEIAHSHPVANETHIGGISRDQWELWVRYKASALWMGQWMDLSWKGTLVELAALKTGTLFECVTETVAISVGLDPVFWRGWGQALGILFQWVDDWDDRAEDEDIQQRNAFNESYEDTMKQYQMLWTRIVQGIGPGWWERPFGTFLWNYFTSVGISEPIQLLSSVTTLPDLFSSTLITRELTFPSSLFQSISSPHLMNIVTCMEEIYPYLQRPIPTPVRTDFSYLWLMDEKDWIGELEKKEHIREYIPLVLKWEHILYSTFVHS